MECTFAAYAPSAALRRGNCTAGMHCLCTLADRRRAPPRGRQVLQHRRINSWQRVGQILSRQHRCLRPRAGVLSRRRAELPLRCLCRLATALRLARGGMRVVQFERQGLCMEA